MPFSPHHISHFKTLASIKTPRVINAVAWMLMVAVTSSTLFLIFTPWVQTTSGPGMVTALDPNDRVQEINALVSGRIETWYVRDGSIVEKGDPIVRIVDNDPLLLQRLDAERQQVLARIRAAETAAATAELDRDRTFQLYEEGLAARRDYEQAQIRLEDLRARVAEAAAALTRLDTQISRQSAQLVRAPRDGMILSLNAGDISTFIDAGQSIATFLPAQAERAVEIFVDGCDVALVQPGDPVRLMF
jgi:multidrug efflux pump subunit AcrA (membrane-fusion protein)